MKRYFITGTDTDCGKTYSTCALLRYFSSLAVAIKPVASGCKYIGQELISEDALAIKKECSLSLDAINPWRFAKAVSPHIAAAENPLSMNEIVKYCLNFTASSSTQYLFIEGAGGLMVPLTNDEFWIDFLKITQIPVILTVGIKTGCINHALLTQQALHYYNIPFLGWIANQIDPLVLAWEENLSTLKRHLNAPLLGIIKHKGEFETFSRFSVEPSY